MAGTQVMCVMMIMRREGVVVQETMGQHYIR